MRSSQQPSPLCGQPDKLPPNAYTPASFHSLPCDIPCKSCVAWGETKDCALKLSAATTSCFRFILKKSFFFFPQAKKLLQCFLALRMEITNYSKSSVRQIPLCIWKADLAPLGNALTSRTNGSIFDIYVLHDETGNRATWWHRGHFRWNATKIRPAF